MSVTKTISKNKNRKSSTVSQPDGSDRPQVLLPGVGREISQFAQQAGEIIGKRQDWFCKGDQVVELRVKQLSKTVSTTVFHHLNPQEVRSAIERYLQPVVKLKNNNKVAAQSVGRKLASALLEARQFKTQLPRIDRILDVPIPVLMEDKLVFAKAGYDEQMNTYCVSNAQIKPLPLPEAKRILCELHKDFCFADSLSCTLAIARLITPMCRGLIGWSGRTPVWVYEGNRPRAGKDYLAGCTGILHEGRANEDVPLDSDSEETSKRITAALMSGRRTMHFSNCKGFIDNRAFEHASTAKFYSARLLGRNDGTGDLSLPNELEFSLSANTGFSFTEDFELRCRKISLSYSEEDANGRRFSYPNLHGWIVENREKLLNAIAGLIEHWDKQGRPKGQTAFTSFPEWAQIVGGIMVCCGLGDPCGQQTTSLTGDALTEDMRKLFLQAYEDHPEKLIDKSEIYRAISRPGAELFPWLDQNDVGSKTSFGKKLKAFENRTLEGIQLQSDYQDKKRPKFKFTKQLIATQKGIANTVFGTSERLEPLAPNKQERNISIAQQGDSSSESSHVPDSTSTSGNLGVGDSVMSGFRFRNASEINTRTGNEGNSPESRRMIDMEVIGNR